MTTADATFRHRANWLGYAGLAPFLIGTLLLRHETLATTALEALHGYAAVILTFTGAIHWGRAMHRGEAWLLSVSVLPSLLAWSSLLLPPGYAIPLLIAGFFSVYLFDRRAYEDAPWFRQMRLRLTAVVCAALALGWFAVP